MGDGVVIELVSISVAVVAVVVMLKEIRTVSKLKERHKQEIKEARADAVKRSRATIEGQVFEQLVPHFEEWTHEPSDARFLGTPVDYIVFDGLSTGEPEKITIVEVKKGSSTTTKVQNKIKKLIKEGKVFWELIKID